MLHASRCRNEYRQRQKLPANWFPASAWGRPSGHFKGALFKTVSKSRPVRIKPCSSRARHLRNQSVRREATAITNKLTAKSIALRCPAFLRAPRFALYSPIRGPATLVNDPYSAQEPPTALFMDECYGRIMDECPYISSRFVKRKIISII
jgi:hypothetical protein